MKKNLTAPIITTMAVGTALGAAYMFTNKKHSTKPVSYTHLIPYHQKDLSAIREL